MFIATRNMLSSLATAVLCHGGHEPAEPAAATAAAAAAREELFQRGERLRRRPVLVNPLLLPLLRPKPEEDVRGGPDGQEVRRKRKRKLFP